MWLLGFELWTFGRAVGCSYPLSHLTSPDNVAIAGEQKEIDKNYRAIGEWFVSEYEGEIPDAVREAVEAVNASKAKIAELEASKPVREEPAETEEDASAGKKCPICGAESDSKFCPQCGAPMGE